MLESRWLRQMILRLRTLFQRNRAERELEEEFQFHLEQRIALETARGLSSEDAHSVALRAMDGIEQRKEECRNMRRANYMDDILRDLRYAGRSLRRSPGFSTLAVLIMGLGIGANTAVFSVVNAVLLKPLSYRDPDRIVTLSDFSKTREASTALSKQVSIPDFQDWHDQSSSFEGMAYYTSGETAVMQGSVAEYARVATLSAEFFRVFSVEPVVGRLFTAEEMKPGSGGAVMISYAYWQNHFGRNPRALGQAIRAYGSRSIVGVMPPGFRFPDKTDLWVPAIIGATPPPRSGENFLAVARLKTSISLEQAQAEMTVIARRLEQRYPESNKGRTVVVTRMRDEMVGNVRLTLYLLSAAVTVVLLIACANAATLLLGKATARTREVAVRAALGASRQRLLRQLITESLLLAFVAGASGLLLAYCGSKALVAEAPADLPRLSETGIDRWVLLFTLGISMITSLLFGLVPPVYASKVDLNDALKRGTTRLVSGGGMFRIRGVLVVTEIALAVVLVSGAGLLIKSLVALHDVALGFQPQNVLVMRAPVPDPPSVAFVRARRFFRDMLSQIGALPGVLAARAIMAPPGYVNSTGGYLIDQLPEKPDWTRAPSVVLSIITPGTFAALETPLKSGRDFSDGDTLDRPFVAVVNEALVRNRFPTRIRSAGRFFVPSIRPRE